MVSYHPCHLLADPVSDSEHDFLYNFGVSYLKRSIRLAKNRSNTKHTLPLACKVSYQRRGIRAFKTRATCVTLDEFCMACLLIFILTKDEER